MSEKKQTELKEEDLTKVSVGQNDVSLFIMTDTRTQSHPYTIDDLYCKYCKTNTSQIYTGTYWGYDSNGNMIDCNVYQCKNENCKQKNYFTTDEGGLL